MPEPTPADASRARLLRRVDDLKIAANALPDALASHLADLDDALAAARDETDRLRAQADGLHADAERERTRAAQAEQAADENARASHAAERALDEARAEIARLRDAAARPKPPRARPASAAAPEPARAVSAPSSTPGPTTADSRLADTFRAWCSAATPVMGKVEFFAGHARSALPGAGVVAVYRDANSQATPVALSARGGASPVEHWLVTLDGRRWLLPQPMTAAQFRELGPCFEGDATPAGLTSVAPAEVRVVGDRYEIARPGRVA